MKNLSSILKLTLVQHRDRLLFIKTYMWPSLMGRFVIGCVEGTLLAEGDGCPRCASEGWTRTLVRRDSEFASQRVHSFIGCSEYCSPKVCGFTLDYAKIGRIKPNKEGFYAMPLTPEAMEDRLRVLRNRAHRTSY